jgi:hypothetical protein
MNYHSQSTANHILESWTYANAAARTGATGFVATDVGRIAYQSDNGSYWRLTATTPTWQYLDDLINNFSTAAQSISAASRTYITGSKMALGKLQIGTILRWKFNIRKTAAGTAASTYDICFGTAGTTADTARVSFTKPAGTGVADEGFVMIEAIVRGPISGSGVVVGEFVMVHNLSATGHATIPCVVVNTVSGTFDVTAPTFAGICITSGASDAITIEQVTAEVLNMA